MLDFLPLGFKMDCTPVRWFWIFIHESMGKYVIYSDEELDGRRWDLHNEGFELLWDSARSRSQAVRYMEDFYPSIPALRRSPHPLPFDRPAISSTSTIGIMLRLKGLNSPWALATGKNWWESSPRAALLVDTVMMDIPWEITRVCVNGAYVHLCSKLYAGARRIAREMGYTSLITYTLDEETGSSVRAAGFMFMGKSVGGSWNSHSRSRVDKHPMGLKNLWMIQMRNALFGDV